MNDKMEQFVKWVEESDNIVFFGGAGVSTESGIPDFRSVDGLYHQKYDYPPETILSHSFYMRKPEEFFRFYKNKMLFPKAEPSTTHKKLAKLEADGKLKGIVTQNIDGLHQKAGSRHVIELHGSVLRNYCERCHQFMDWMPFYKVKEFRSVAAAEESNRMSYYMKKDLMKKTLKRQSV